MTRTVPLMIFKIHSTCPRPPSRAPPWSCPSSAAGSCSRPTQEINQSINQSTNQSNIYPPTHADIASQDIDGFCNPSLP